MCETLTNDDDSICLTRLAQLVIGGDWDQVILTAAATSKDLVGSNARTARGRTVLSLAADAAEPHGWQYAKCVELLLHLGADPRLGDSIGGDTAAHVAARRDNVCMLALLPFEAKFLANRHGLTPLMAAVATGSWRCAKHLLHLFRLNRYYGFKADCLDMRNNEGRTALQIAIDSEQGDLAEVIRTESKLVVTGEGREAKLILSPEQMNTCKTLTQLTLDGDLKQLRSLASRVNCDLPDEDGLTVLMQAIKSNAGEVFNFLAEISDATAANTFGISCLHIAAAYCNVAAVHALIDNGAPVNGCNCVDETPLMWAAGTPGGDEVTRALLNSGADWTRLDNWGRTALTVSQQWRRGTTASLLRSYAHTSFFDEPVVTAREPQSTTSGPAPSSPEPSPAEPPRTPESLEHLQVIVPRVKPPDEEAYKVTSPQGLCLIINVIRYETSNGIESRPGSEGDVQLVKRLFNDLNFRVELLLNPKCHEIFDRISEIASSKQPYGHGCFVCVVMARGTTGRICASDGLVLSISDVMTRLGTNQCLDLRYKPKIFLLQLNQPAGTGEASNSRDAEDGVQLCDKDFLLSHSSCSCKPGERSRFLTTLCDVIKRCYRHEDLTIMIDKATAESRGAGCSCSASMLTTLTKKCCLDPNKASSDCVRPPDEWSDDQLASACKSGTDVNKLWGPFDETLLIISVKRGLVDCVQALLAKSASVSVRDSQGRTAVSWAGHSGQDGMLTEFRAAPTIETDVNQADHAGLTPVMLAASKGHVTAIDLLHQMGADLNLQDIVGSTAMIHAARQGHSEAVGKLADLSADPRLTDADGNSALVWAARMGHRDVVGKLSMVLRQPDDWLAEGEYGRTAEQWAEYCGHADCAGFIRECIRELPDRATDANRTSPPDDPDGQGGGGSGGSSSSGGDIGGACGGGGPSGAAPGGDSTGGGPPGPPGRPPGPPGPRYSVNPSGGLAILVNIVKFTDPLQFPDRDGAMADTARENLCRAFNKLGFAPSKVRVLYDVKRDALLNLVAMVTDAEYSACSVFLLCLMSHGELDHIISHDSARVPLEDIFSQFRRHPGLQNKPKIFITQACRVVTVLSRQMAVGQCSAEMRGDSLYLFSVAVGGLSQRNWVLGGIFAQAFRDVIFDCGSRLDSTEFTQLLHGIAKRVADATNNRQNPCFRSTLQKSLCLHA